MSVHLKLRFLSCEVTIAETRSRCLSQYQSVQAPWEKGISSIVRWYHCEESEEDSNPPEEPLLHLPSLLVGYSPWGCQQLDATERVHTHTHAHTHTVNILTLMPEMYVETDGIPSTWVFSIGLSNFWLEGDLKNLPIFSLVYPMEPGTPDLLTSDPTQVFTSR